MNLNTIIDGYETIWTSGKANYKDFNLSEEQRFIKLFRAFSEEYPNHFNRSDVPGHFTGSALVVNRALDKVLLTHHRKMNRWLQLGGHADGDRNISGVALREAHEESGIPAISLIRFEALLSSNDTLSSPIPFDLDRHDIAPHKGEPEHYHYDVRYLMVADDLATVLVSEESHDVKWFSLEEAYRMTDERSMHRQLDKLAWLKTHPDFIRNF